MFVQIIEGNTSDPEGLKRQGERWQEELRPGAVGYLGVTAGTTKNGRAITVVRFESEAGARANSERPEQGEWFRDLEEFYDGPLQFSESSDVTELLGGGSDQAGFVQIMKNKDADRSTLERLDEAFGRVAADLRPDVLGGLRVWTGPGECLEVMYFTSEAAAREAESGDPPAELQDLMGDFQAAMANTEFLDLTDPAIH